MGLLSKLVKKKTSSNKQTSNGNTLIQDITIASDCIVNALNSSGYLADYTIKSMKEIDRFFDEQNTPTGILSHNRGKILFSLSSYIGQTIIKLYGGEWITDDNDPKGELNIAVRLKSGEIIWPALRCIKRYDLGQEESIYAYVFALSVDKGSNLPNSQINFP